MLNKIKQDLKEAMMKEVEFRKNNILNTFEYNNAIDQKNVSRTIISMFPEIGIKPDKAEDNDTIKLLKKYIKSEKLRELYQLKYITQKDVEGKSAKEVSKLENEKLIEFNDILVNNKILIAEKYLPQIVFDSDIRVYLKTIDFSKLKNKMQAIGMCKNHFGNDCVDSNLVKNIIEKEY
jgi:uncharacterized protein YqeY